MTVVKKTLCVLLSGKAGVGKTTSAKYLKDYLETKYNLKGRIISIAGGVKQSAKECYGWDGVKDSRGRKLLQSVGRIGREYNEDVWIKKAYEEMTSSEYPYDFIIIDDWRFPNEKNFLLSKEILHTITVRIEAPNREILKGTPEYRDTSEVSLPSVMLLEDKGIDWTAGLEYKYCLDNRGKLEELYSSLEILADREIDNLRFKQKN